MRVRVGDKKSSPSERVMGTLRSLVEVCEANGVDVLRFVWLDTKANFIADLLSRAQGAPAASALSAHGLRKRWQVPALADRVSLPRLQLVTLQT